MSDNIERKVIDLSSVPMKDAVNSPSHYTFGKYEVIDVIEEWMLPFHLANVVKYIARAGRKTKNARIDLEKAEWYFKRFLAKRNTFDTGNPPNTISSFGIIELLADWNLQSDLDLVMRYLFDGDYMKSQQHLTLYIDTVYNRKR
jgi:hypothetical protein